MSAKKRRLSAPQSVALIMMALAVAFSITGAVIGQNVLIVIGVLDLGMAMILWRIKARPKQNGEAD